MQCFGTMAYYYNGLAKNNTYMIGSKLTNNILIYYSTYGLNYLKIK